MWTEDDFQSPVDQQTRRQIGIYLSGGPGRYQQAHGAQASAEYIARRLAEEGSHVFYGEDGRCYIYVAPVSKVISIFKAGRTSLTPEAEALFLRRYGLSMTDKLHQRVVHEITSHNTQRLKTHRFAHYDDETNTLYISNYDGTVWRVTTDRVDSVTNGDGVFFLDDDGGTPVEPVFDRTDDVLERLLVQDVAFMQPEQGYITVESQQIMLTIWMHCLAFGPLLSRGRPMLVVEGSAGAGKTSCMRRVQLALQGKEALVSLDRSNSVEDFALVLHRNPIAIFDNVDNYVDWLPNALATYLTGGTWSRRKRFTDSDMSDVKPEAFPVLTSRNPRFNRDDVADRSVILHLGRRTKFRGEKEVADEIKAARPAIMGEWIQNLQRILAMLEDRQFVESATRLAEFDSLSRIIGTALGFSHEQVDHALAETQEERISFIAQSNTFLELLVEYVALRTQNTPVLEITLKKLHVGLRDHVVMRSGHYLAQTSGTLLHLLEQNMAALKRYLRIEKAHGRYRFELLQPLD